jgi:hypothetical protein
MASPENRGNLITRRAFADEYGERTGRTAAFCRMTAKARSTAYQMMEEVGEFGSGTPSPLHVLCELVRAAEEFDRAEGSEVSYAHELASYPLAFLRQLRAGGARADSVQKINLVLKSASDANYMLKGRRLEDLPPGELRAFNELMMTVAGAALELEMLVDALLGAQDFPGAPVPGERRLTLTGTDD